MSESSASRKSSSRCIGMYLLIILILGLNTAAFYRNGTAYADFDTAAELMLAKLLNQEHRLLCSPNWIYSTELRVLNTQIFYRIGFLFTNNWHLARTISLLLMWIFLLACFRWFMKSAKITDSPVLSTLAVILPFSLEYTLFVIYGGYYVPHIALLFLMLGLYYRTVNSRKNTVLQALAVCARF